MLPMISLKKLLFPVHGYCSYRSSCNEPVFIKCEYGFAVPCSINSHDDVRTR